MRPVVIIDNYDSFTYNLYQYVLEITPHVQVYRNDRIEVSEIRRLSPWGIIISPGPRDPRHAGISGAVIRGLGEYVNILGICLGHQCINEVFGGRTIRAPEVCHGKTSEVRHDGRTLFRGLPPRIQVARYHSLIVDAETLPPELEVSARGPDGIIMGLRHKTHPIEGVQFHPESFMTPRGKDIIRNWFTA